MIKFWKSSAKGKSGCPVRPPENIKEFESLDIVSNVDISSGDLSNLRLFDKKSKLTITFDDVVLKKQSIDYFVQYLDSIGKATLIKCWLELENFNILRNASEQLNEDRSKICRTQSFDCNTYSCKITKTHVLQNCNLNENQCHETIPKNLFEKNQTTAKSCENIVKNVMNYQKKDVIEEAICLFKKYVALEAPNQLELPDNVRKIIISNICQPEGNIKEDCFKPVENILYTELKNYFTDFQNSPLYIKAQIDVLTSGSLSIKDLLYNDFILFYFTEYLEQEHCSSLLEFLIAVMHFRDNLLTDSPPTPSQAQADAIVLYEKYFSLQATNPIGFSTDVRLQIESDICREGGPLPTCFDAPYAIVFKKLECYVKTFLDSEIYFKYLSEMIHSVNQNWSSKSQSDSSSEYSISTQNTLLAMGDTKFPKKKRKSSVHDMTIDSNQLYNADSLWQRKRYDGLNLGRVNSLGRFESKFEPDPDKKKKSVLRKMVSRFVPANSSQVEEEMAWQIAHMIVKDVTDLTMAPPDKEL